MSVDLGNRSAEQLRALVERVESLEEEKASVAARAREIYAEAKAHGYCVKTMRALVRERRLDPDERAERDAMLALYREALGALDGTPLGGAAMGAAAAGADAALRGRRKRAS